MALDAGGDFHSLKMKQRILTGNKCAAKSLLNLCTLAAVGNINKLLNEIPLLPDNLRAQILQLMSKRNNLLTDQTLSQVCSEVIRELDFTNTALVSDQGLLSLPRLPYLRKLDLNDTRTGTRDSITSAGLEHIAKQCPNLQIAYFRRCRYICDKGITALAEGCRRLTEINLSGCPQVSDDSIYALAENCTNLHSINLAYTNITDEGAYYLAYGACGPKLQEVHISHCKRVTDQAVTVLLYAGTSITYLEIQGCPLLTDKSLEAIEQLRERYDLKQFNWTIKW